MPPSPPGCPEQAEHPQRHTDTPAGALRAGTFHFSLIFPPNSLLLLARQLLVGPGRGRSSRPPPRRQPPPGGQGRSGAVGAKRRAKEATVSTSFFFCPPPSWPQRSRRRSSSKRRQLPAGGCGTGTHSRCHRRAPGAIFPPLTGRWPPAGRAPAAPLPTSPPRSLGSGPGQSHRPRGAAAPGRCSSSSRSQRRVLGGAPRRHFGGGGNWRVAGGGFRVPWLG